MAIENSDIKFFYKGKFLGSCEAGYMNCDKLHKLLKTDKEAATQVLNYLNSLGDPVFSTFDDEFEAETNIDNVDVDELYYAFMQELGYEYDEHHNKYDFVVGGDAELPDFEIFDGEVVDGVDLEESYKRESYLREYVRPEVEKAWDLLDDWFEREWGEIPYNESAKSILVAEFPMDVFVDGDFVDGTGAVVLNLIDCAAYYAVYDDNGDMYADNTDTYSNIQDMIDKLIQPMHDGEITEDDLYAKLERLAY